MEVENPSFPGSKCRPDFYFWDTRYTQGEKLWVRYMWYQVGGQDEDWEWREGVKCLDEDFDCNDLILLLEE